MNDVTTEYVYCGEFTCPTCGPNAVWGPADCEPVLWLDYCSRSHQRHCAPLFICTFDYALLSCIRHAKMNDILVPFIDEWHWKYMSNGLTAAIVSVFLAPGLAGHNEERAVALRNATWLAMSGGGAPRSTSGIHRLPLAWFPQPGLTIAQISAAVARCKQHYFASPASVPVLELAICANAKDPARGVLADWEQRKSQRHLSVYPEAGGAE